MNDVRGGVTYPDPKRRRGYWVFADGDVLAATDPFIEPLKFDGNSIVGAVYSEVSRYRCSVCGEPLLYVWIGGGGRTLNGILSGVTVDGRTTGILSHKAAYHYDCQPEKPDAL